MRRSPVLSTLGFLLAPVGLILLATQVVRVVGYDATLNTLGTVLLWAGVGALAVGLLLLALTVTDDGTAYAAPAAPEADTAVPPAGTRADDPADSEPARPVHTEPAPVTPAAAPAASSTPAPDPAPAAAEPAAPVPPVETSSLERLRRHATADEPTEIQHVPEGGGYAAPADSEPSDPSAE